MLDFQLTSIRSSQGARFERPLGPKADMPVQQL